MCALRDADLVESFLYDEMHGFCLGVARKVSCSWLERGKNYSLTENQVGLVFSVSVLLLCDICRL